MARIRAIKPDFFLDESLAELAPVARLLFIGLWTLADKDGLLEDRPKRIKASLFPYDATDVGPLLADLDAAGFIVRYEVDGVACIAIRNFGKHQRPHPKETSYGLPPCPSTASREKKRQGADASRRVPVVDGDGCLLVVDGNGDGVSASQAAASAAPVASGEEADTPERPPLVLTQPGKPERKPREPSAAERLYAGLEEARRERCERERVNFIPEGWPPARVNKQLGPLAKATGAEAERLNDAFAEFLADPRGVEFDPPWSLGMFLVRRSQYESKAVRAAGGAP